MTDAGGGELTGSALKFISIYYSWRHFQNIFGRTLIVCGNSIAYRAVLGFLGRIPGSPGMTTRYLRPNMEPFGGEAATQDEETFEFEPRFSIETKAAQSSQIALCRAWRDGTVDGNVGIFRVRMQSNHSSG